MIRFRLIIGFIFLLTSIIALSQNGKITGTVMGKDGTLEFVPVQIINTNVGTYTDEFGWFELTNIPTGQRTVKVRALGYKTYTKNIDLSDGETIELNIILEEDKLSLDEVVISGTRYEVDRKDAPVVVNVVDRKLFSSIQSQTISEGLNFQPGVRIETNCQNCGFTQVRLNGLEGGYSQVLINSRPVFSALNSVYGLEQIPTAIVEQVEVVRSGGSALYGSNAIAGTVNIITREPEENSWQIGSNFALINGDTPDNTVNFNGSIVNNDLISGVTFFGMFRDRDSFDANNDGFTEMVELENNTFGAKAFLKPGERSKISLDLSAINEYRRGGDRLELAPHFTDIAEELDHNTLIAGVTYDQWSKNQKSKISAYASGQRTKRMSFYGGLGGGRTAEDSIAAINAYGLTSDLSFVSGFQFTHSFNTGDVLTMGVENHVSEVKDEIPGYNRLVDQHVNTTGIYGQYEWKPLHKITALIGARYDHTIVDGLYRIETIERTSKVNPGVFSPRLTLMYRLTEDIRLRAGYARGFRAPQAFNEDMHISSVGGEPLFVILSEDLDKETSDAYTASVNIYRNVGIFETNLLVEGFYTRLYDPFTFVSTGATLSNGSILEEVRNGNGASVSGINFEVNLSPSPLFSFQLGGTWQQTRYNKEQVLFEPELPTEEAPLVAVSEFTRTPDLYGFFTTYWKPINSFEIDITGTYTGTMIVPRVVSESGFPDLTESDPFMDVNLKLTYHLEILNDFHLEFSGGIQNIFNSYQNDFDSGPERDSDYIYGPARPRTFFLGIKIGNLH